MPEELVTLLAHIGAIAGLGLIGAALWRREFRFGWFAGTLCLYILYDLLLTRGFWSWPNLFPAADWNWTGKLLALSGMMLLASTQTFGWRRCGFTLAHRPGSWPAVMLGACLVVVFFALAIAGADGADDGETIAFQWTMPGLDEEVFYRGVLLLAMNEAFRNRWTIFGAQIGFGGLLTSVLFALAHGLGYADGGFSVDGATCLMTGLPSLLLLWMRERTGSLLLPILTHNAANGAFTLF